MRLESSASHERSDLTSSARRNITPSPPSPPFSQTTLLALLAFFFIIAVEATLYAIYFQKLNKHRDSEAKAKAKWMAGGLTFVPEEDKPEMIPLDRLLELEEAKSEEKSDGVVVIEVSEAPKGQGKSGREKGKREGLRKREGKAKD